MARGPEVDSGLPGALDEPGHPFIGSGVVAGQEDDATSGRPAGTFTLALDEGDLPDGVDPVAPCDQRDDGAGSWPMRS